MTRGRHTNTAHLYERATGDHEYGQQEPDGTHVKHRGDSREAAALVRRILTNYDQLAVTAHDYAALTPGAALPDRECGAFSIDGPQPPNAAASPTRIFKVRRQRSWLRWPAAEDRRLSVLPASMTD
jgi:hypothetical protein